MDARRFDTWTRNRALRLSRRNALRLLGAGGVAATLPPATREALAQTTCTLTVLAATGAGPSAPATYDGVLQFTRACRILPLPTELPTQPGKLQFDISLPMR